MSATTEFLVICLVLSLARAGAADTAAPTAPAPANRPAQRAPSPEPVRAIRDGAALVCNATDVRAYFREAPDGAMRFSCRASGRDGVCTGSLLTDSGGARSTTLYFKRDDRGRSLLDMIVFSDEAPLPPKTAAFVRAEAARRRRCPTAR